MVKTAPYIRSIFLQIILGLGLFLLTGSLVQGQEQPDTPEIIRVSIESDTLYIEWKPSNYADVDIYRINKLITPGTAIVPPLFDVPKEVLSYKIALPHREFEPLNLLYGIQAVDTLDSREDELRSALGDQAHKAVSMFSEFDACNASNLVKWSHYEGWGAQLAHYEVYGALEGEEFERLALVDRNKNSFQHRDIQADQRFVYYVKAIHTSGITSSSPLDTVSTLLPEKPQLLRIDEVDVMDEQTVEIRVSVDPDAETKDYRLRRNSGQSSFWNTVSYLRNVNTDTYVMTDRVITRDQSFAYRLEAIYSPEGCSDEIVLDSSNTGRNILLEASLEGPDVKLNWTAYDGFENGLSGYMLKRTLENGEVLDTFYPESLEAMYTDYSVADLINRGYSGEITYQIEAHANHVSGGLQSISSSNFVTIRLETKMQIPNAFIPNGDNEYDQVFKPIMDFYPEKYLMIIYDRSGRKLFETTNPDEGWDGSGPTGGMATEGVYVYFIKYTDYAGNVRSENGSVTAIYQ